MLPKNYKGIVYQIIRPTGLLDPVVEIRPIVPETLKQLINDVKKNNYNDMPLLSEDYVVKTQISDLIEEIKKVTAKSQRVIVITLTKKMAEELSDFLIDQGIKSKYLHSDIDTVERVEILRDLRKGLYDVIIGINLLREGLDLPEVSLVAILDADKEGFLRSKTSLVQIIGRAARHSEGRVIMYANKITDSMKFAIDETRRRRDIQERFNIENNITPKSVDKSIVDQLDKFKDGDSVQKEDNQSKDLLKLSEAYSAMSKKEQHRFKKEIKLQMQIHADLLEFEKAAELRDLVKSLG